MFVMAGPCKILAKIHKWINFLIFIIIVEDDGIDYRGSITRSCFPH
ncbi:hypothetical protein HMPREF1602_05608 [Escherichia coli 907889]|nr:hypothetical protein HMPREF1588_05448 [Escherichia coli 110957]ESD29679.1 hypothetical protein HMPREF1602_05608 [Escherichia coli 907889]